MFAKANFVVVLILSIACFAFCDIYSPIAYWAFDDGIGTVANDSSGENDGTIHGATWTTGKIGGALAFSGIDYVDCGDGANLDQMGAVTLSVWVSAQWQDFGAGIITKDGSYELGIVPSSDNYNVYATLWGQHPAGFNSPDDIIALNDWYHIVLVNSGSVQKLYINGGEVNSSTINTGAINNSNKSLKIGTGRDAFVSTGFKGIIDEVRIYDYALSPTEVLELYQIPEPATLLFLFAGALGIRRMK